MMELVTGISSIVIALCALGLSVWQACVARKHNKLSFKPHLSLMTHRDAEKGFYSVELINNGIGPAVIEDFSIKVDGKQVAGEGTEPLEKALKIVLPNLHYLSKQSYLAKGYSMAPKERCTVFAVQFTGKPMPTKEFIEHALNRGDLEICYKSFYEETFRFSTHEDESKPT